MFHTIRNPYSKDSFLSAVWESLAYYDPHEIKFQGETQTEYGYVYVSDEHYAHVKKSLMLLGLDEAATVDALPFVFRDSKKNFKALKGLNKKNYVLFRHYVKQLRICKHLGITPTPKPKTTND